MAKRNEAPTKPGKTVVLPPQRDETIGTDLDADVNHPDHYTQGEIECIDAIESALGTEGFKAFLRGQILKYTWRLERKDNAVKDACKAQWYLHKLIDVLEKEN